MQSTYKHVSPLIHFPDGTTSVTEVETFKDGAPTQPTFHIRDSDGVISILQTAARQSVTSINIPFFPFSRNDHPPHSDLSTFISALDAQRKVPLRVTTFDPHSEMIEALFNESDKLILDVQHHEFKNIIAVVTQSIAIYNTNKKPILVVPDAGAAKKYLKIFQNNFFHNFDGYIQCNKFRDQETGKLSGFSVSDPREYCQDPDNTFLIVDDICDGGGTFLGIAAELSKLGIKSERLHLYVSHGIFSNGLDTLFESFKSISTTDSIATSSDPRLKYYSIFGEK